MPLRRTRPASCAGALTLLTALLLAGGSARGAAAPTQLTDVQQASVQLVKGFLDPRLSTTAVEAVISSARDGKMGMAYMLEQLDRCWTRVTQMPREPLAEAE